MGVMIMRPGAAVQQVLRLSQRCRVSQEGEALDVIVCARAHLKPFISLRCGADAVNLWNRNNAALI